MATMINIEINADKIKFLTALGIGTIDMAEIKDFQSLTNQG